MGPAVSVRTKRVFQNLRVAALVAVIVGVCAVIASAAVSGPGAPVFVYQTTYNGTTPEPGGSDPATFNTAVYGAATPPAADLLASSSTWGGQPLLNELIAGNQFDGTQLYPCPSAFFLTCDPSGNAVASTVSTPTQVFEFIAVQSWPFYVGKGASSNINNGKFTLETTSADGSWLVLGAAAFTYAQPGNFQRATGLSAGNAVVNNSGNHAPTSVQGSFTIDAAQDCAINIYWVTMESAEAEGGAAQIEYSWDPPGKITFSQMTQSVIYGQVRYLGTGAAGETVVVSDPNGGTHTLTTDSQGCYGYNYLPYSGTQPITITATDTANTGQTITVTDNLPMGGGVRQDFDFPIAGPNVQMFKRITRISTLGPTPGPTTTPRIITPTPDPGSLTGVNGTVNYGPFPGDILTFTIYFRNIGGGQAGSGGTGPTFQDVLALPQAYVGGSQTFTCCTSPTGTIGAAVTQTGQTLKWVMAAPLRTPAPSGTAAPIQGNMSYQVTIP